MNFRSMPSYLGVAKFHNARSAFLGKGNANRKNKVKNEAKRFDPSERNFNFEFRSWATAPREFVTLFLPLNSLEIQHFCEF